MDAFEYARDVTGDFTKAHKRLEKVIGKTKKTNETKGDGTKVDEKKPETESQLRERIEREVLEKHGLLNKEKVNPSTGGGRSWTKQQIAQMSPEEFAKNEEAIFEAVQRGKIK